MICCSHTVDSVHLGRFKQEKHFNTLPGDVFSHSVTAFVWKVVSEQNQIQMFSYNACLKKTNEPDGARVGTHHQCFQVNIFLKILLT